MPFPKERRLTPDELRIKIFREIALVEVKAIALALVRQMEDAAEIRCEFCGRLLYGDADQAGSDRS